MSCTVYFYLLHLCDKATAHNKFIGKILSATNTQDFPHDHEFLAQKADVMNWDFHQIGTSCFIFCAVPSILQLPDILVRVHKHPPFLQFYNLRTDSIWKCWLTILLWIVWFPFVSLCSIKLHSSYSGICSRVDIA